MIYLKIGTIIESFEPLSCIPKLTTDAVTGTTLRSNLYEHTGAARRGYEIIIGADSILDEETMDFLENWFYDGSRELSFNGTDYFKVFIKPGDFPVDFVEAIKFLPQVKFTCQSKAPGKDRKPGESLFD